MHTHGFVMFLFIIHSSVQLDKQAKPWSPDITKQVMVQYFWTDFRQTSKCEMSVFDNKQM